MNTILFIVIIFGQVIQNVARKAYNKKVEVGAFAFSALSTLAAVIFFLFTSGFKLTFSFEYIPYSIGFGVSYGMALVFTFLAITCGSLALTSLITSFALLVPSVVGLIFLNETAGLALYIGLVLLVISLFLVNYEKGEKKITVKWLIYVFLAFWGNGICSTVQKLQQTAFNGEFKNEFMIAALVIVTVALTVIALITEKKAVFECVKKGSVESVVCGAGNGLANYLVMVMAGRLPASVMYPIISAGGILGSLLVAVFLYREKLSKNQIAGIILGTLAIVFLDL